MTKHFTDFFIYDVKLILCVRVIVSCICSKNFFYDFFFFWYCVFFLLKTMTEKFEMVSKYGERKNRYLKLLLFSIVLFGFFLRHFFCVFLLYKKMMAIRRPHVLTLKRFCVHIHGLYVSVSWRYTERSTIWIKKRFLCMLFFVLWRDKILWLKRLYDFFFVLNSYMYT